MGTFIGISNSTQLHPGSGSRPPFCLALSPQLSMGSSVLLGAQGKKPGMPLTLSLSSFQHLSGSSPALISMAPPSLDLVGSDRKGLSPSGHVFMCSHVHVFTSPSPMDLRLVPGGPPTTPPTQLRAPTLIFVKNCRKQARGSTFRLLASSKMNCMTIVWWATCSMRAHFCRGRRGTVSPVAAAKQSPS